MRTIKSISIKKFIEISDLIKDETTIHERMNVFQIVTGCDMEDIRIIPAQILDTMWNEFVHNCFDLGDGSIDNIITIDGKSYGLTNVKKLTVGEMADIDVLKNHPVLNFNLHKIMAILYRPLVSKLPFKIEEYTSEGFEERAELFAEKMPVKVALNTAVFFLNILGNLNGATKDSLESDNEPNDKKENNERQDTKVARGWNSFIYFLAKDDILKINEVTKIELITAYNFLAHQKNKNDTSN